MYATYPGWRRALRTSRENFVSPACSPGAGGYPSPNEAAVLFSGRPGIRGPSRMYAMREMTENAAIVNTQFAGLVHRLRVAVTSLLLNMLSGRDCAQGREPSCGTDPPMPLRYSLEFMPNPPRFCNRLRTRGRRICGGFPADLRRICQLPAGRNRGVETARTMRGNRSGGYGPGDMVRRRAYGPAGIARLSRRTAMRRIPEYPDTGTPLEQSPKRPQAGTGFASSTTVCKGTVRKGTVCKGTVRKGDEKRQSSLPRQLTRGRLFRSDSRKTESDPKSG